MDNFEALLDGAHAMVSKYFLIHDQKGIIT